ncbi:MAG: SPOR domain-containing protein [Sphingomonadaceae bacterium]|nr:SPOR domain-containing protein [Sphingomonadaceae bacterium]
MSRRGRVEDDDDEDSPPWLAPASADHRRGTIVSSRKLNMWLLLLGGLLLLVIALIYAQVAKPEDDSPVYAGADGEVPLIRAPDSPFKIRPKDPGGLNLEGNNQSAFEAAGGLDPGGELNFDALPEEPIDRAELAARAAPRPAPPATVVEAEASTGTPAPEPAKPVVTPVVKPVPKPEVKTAPRNETKEPVPAADGGNFALQLGAFSSESKANEAWKNFTGRYSYLADLGKSVVPVERDDTKLYRLRATGIGSRAQADNLCARLKVAGDQCTVID